MRWRLFFQRLAFALSLPALIASTIMLVTGVPAAAHLFCWLWIGFVWLCYWVISGLLPRE